MDTNENELEDLKKLCEAQKIEIQKLREKNKKTATFLDYAMCAEPRPEVVSMPHGCKLLIYEIQPNQSYSGQVFLPDGNTNFSVNQLMGCSAPCAADVEGTAKSWLSRFQSVADVQDSITAFNKHGSFH